MCKPWFHILLFFTFPFFSILVFSWKTQKFHQEKYLTGSSQLVDLAYHMGPVLASPIKLYIIWYGHWDSDSQSTIRDFIHSLSSTSVASPSVADWWRTVRQYTDQTGANVTADIVLSGEHSDRSYQQGMFLTRLAIQSVIKSAIFAFPDPLPLDPKDGVYLVLTSSDVQVQDFCRAVCGFHYFTFPAIVGVTVPYAWIGNSKVQCPGMCAYPFAKPSFGIGPDNSTLELMGAPNGEIGVDGMVSIMAHEMAEMATDPLVNGWYAGSDPTAPTEIADLCVGVYGSGGGGGYVGKVYRDSEGNGYNLNGVGGRRFLVQWVWSPVRNSCFGPNAATVI